MARKVVIAGLMLVSAVFGASAEEFYGPLRIRDMGPIGLLRLHMLPDHAIEPSAGRHAFELHLSQSNTFAMDSDVSDYLDQRGRRAEISPEDAANILAASDNVFFFDGSLGLFQLTTHYAFDENWSGYLTVPAHYYGGGFMDAGIEKFHEHAGFSTFGREYVNRNEFQALLAVDGQSFVQLTRPRRGGLGDPVLGLRYYRRVGEGSALTFELAHKPSTHDAGSFLSTGSADTGLQVSWHQLGKQNGWYVNLAVVKVGAAAPFESRTRHYAPSVNLAWEYALGGTGSLVLQLNAMKNLYRGESLDEELTSNVYQASVGMRHRHGEFIWSYALTENLVNFNNSADLGFYIGFTWAPVPD